MPVDPKRVQAVFLAAREEHDLAARATLVDRECQADTALRRQVEALLRRTIRPRAISTSRSSQARPGCRGPHGTRADEGEAGGTGRTHRRNLRSHSLN